MVPDLLIPLVSWKMDSGTWMFVSSLKDKPRYKLPVWQDRSEPTSRQARHSLPGDAGDQRKLIWFMSWETNGKRLRGGCRMDSGEARLWDRNVRNNETPFPGSPSGGLSEKEEIPGSFEPLMPIWRKRWGIEKWDHVVINDRAGTWTQVFSLAIQRENRVEKPSGLEEFRGFGQRYENKNSCLPLKLTVASDTVLNTLPTLPYWIHIVTKHSNRCPFLLMTLNNNNLVQASHWEPAGARI